jgi:phage-related protein
VAAKPVKIAYIADTSELRSSLAKAEAAMNATGDTAKAAGAKVDAAFDSTADHADTVASKGSQAAGALSGLGDLVGGKFGAAMVVGGTAMQGLADAGDLVNVVTDSAIVRKIKDTAVTIGQTAAHVASAVAQKALAAASKAWAAAQWLVNAALSANPIGLVVVAIAGLVAGLVIAWKKSETFRAIVTGAFDKVKAAASAAFGWVKDNWPTILAILTGPIGLAVLAITKNWDKIKAGATAVKDWIVGKFDGLVGFVKGLPSRIGAATAGMWDGVKNGFRSALNWIIGKWNDLHFTIPKVDRGALGNIGTGTIDFPNIPKLAKGGIVNSPTLALIGEAGPEAVVPLNRGAGETGRGGRGDFLLERILDALHEFPEVIGREIARESKRSFEEEARKPRRTSYSDGLQTGF